MKRPRCLIVLGIINIVIAVAWVVKGITMMTYTILPFALLEQNNWSGVDLRPAEAIYAALEDPYFMTYWVAGNLLGVVAGLGLAVGGVGLILARSWGKRWSMIWAGYAILAGAVTVGMMQSHLVPEMESALGRLPSEGFLSAVGVIGELAMRWLYPILLTVFLSRPAVIAAFDQAKKHREILKAGYTPIPADTLPSIEGPPTIPAPARIQSSTPMPTPIEQASPSPSPPPPEQQTWRDDPWNDPSAT